MNDHKICSFTGHRNIDITQELKLKLAKTVEALIKEDVTDFYSGGAIGWDILCAYSVLYLKRKYPQIKLNMLLPCPPEDQCMKWNSKQKALYDRMLQAADSVTILADRYYNGCMAVRNEKLIEKADVCVCYCSRRSSGTGQTVNMAESKGIRVINLFEGLPQ